MNNLAYIKGVMDGDGYINRGNQNRPKHGIGKPRLQLHVTSKSFADCFAKATKKAKLTPRKYEYNRQLTFGKYSWKSKIYIINATCSEEFLERLNSLDLRKKRGE